MDRVFVHPNSLVESEEIGPGTRVWAFAHILRGARVGGDCNIGDHCFLENGAWVGDGVTIKNGNMIWDGITLEDGVFVGPQVSFTNDRYPRSGRLPEARAVKATGLWLLPTRVCRGAALGASSVILPGITIGEYAMVGAGAVVTIADEPPVGPGTFQNMQEKLRSA